MRLRPWIYDATVVRMTAAWYHAVLERLPVRCHLLDVGIGTGGALLANADLLARKDLRVTGIDVDVAYVEHCRRAVARRGLGDRVAVRLESVYDHRGGPYDAAYFSGSFMLLPDPVAALRHVSTLLAPGSRIYFTQTVERRRSRTVEALKPLLRLVTTIDFGRVTYEATFRCTLAAGGIELEARETLHQGSRRSAILAVGLTSARPGGTLVFHGERMNQTKRSGGCWCGAVELEITGDPVAMVYCHCDSCRRWLGAPIHAASLWPTPNVVVRKGEDRLGVFTKTEASHRHFCTRCGSPVLIRHPAMGFTDVPAGSVAALDYAPTMHVHYGEKVLSVRDGLPKWKDMPGEFGGSGDRLPE